VKRWYAVFTHANREGRAQDNLRRQGYEVYLPMLRRVLRHARRVESVLRPLFPRYLFVSLDPDRDRWRPISSTYGVSGLVRFADVPASVPVSFIDDLRTHESDGVRSDEPAVPDWCAGDRLRLIGGAFADMIGRFESMSSADRVLLLLEVMGREVRVAAPTHLLETA
jgi:transcriptional antiterminator RfaH